MPQQVTTAVENNFTKGLVTEFTGLNFPENAATDCDNTFFEVTGNVVRRLGIDFENNFFDNSALVDRTNCAINTYKWNNAGGDGNTQFIVTQVGTTIYFFKSSAATLTNPLSHQLTWSVNLVPFAASGVIPSTTSEAQFADGNGYLFVFHPDCDPVFCTWNGASVTGAPIDIKIRDFIGAVDSLQDNSRPPTLTDPHNYNLQNQGWITAAPWFAQSTSSNSVINGVRIFTVPAGLTGVAGGQVVIAQAYVDYGTKRQAASWMYGTVTSYVGTTLTLNITGANPIFGVGPFVDWDITPNNVGYTATWFASQGNYPSNADVWWRFKNASGVFDPATTQPNVSISLGPAPKGHFILSAFNQDRNNSAGLNTITTISTDKRPTNGAWFQGRIWYTGVNDNELAAAFTNFTTWTENIYFSQVVNKPDDFGKCYQTNDPTSQELFDILPTDGGIIVIQGSGPIYKLFPTQNGLLVFAGNGVWFITGSQGIGFSATDYTVTKLSSIESLSSTSFVDVEGLPYFWNEDGIYAVQPQQGGGLSVNSLTYSTIGAFYDEIPLQSKRYVRGVYQPITYTIQWLYKSADEISVEDRYSFDRILNYNVYNKAFFPYSVSISGERGTSINGINFVQSPGGGSAPPSAIKYFSSYFNTSSGNFQYTFAEEWDADYVDWDSTDENIDYVSYFVTGYKIRGQGIRKSQLQYLQIWSNTHEEPLSYNLQALWDYANSGDSGKWTSSQRVELFPGHFDVISRRHKIRGRGYAVQFKVTSTPGEPFDIIGWAAIDTINAGT